MSLPINQPEGPIDALTQNAILDYAGYTAQLGALQAEKTRLASEMTVLGDQMVHNAAAITAAQNAKVNAEIVLAGNVSEEDPIGPVFATTEDRSQVTLTVLVNGQARTFVATVLPLPAERAEIPPAPAPVTPEPPIAVDPAPVTPEPEPAPVVVEGEATPTEPAPTPTPEA